MQWYTGMTERCLLVCTMYMLFTPFTSLLQMSMSAQLVHTTVLRGALTLLDLIPAPVTVDTGWIAMEGHAVVGMTERCLLVCKYFLHH